MLIRHYLNNQTPFASWNPLPTKTYFKNQKPFVINCWPKNTFIYTQNPFAMQCWQKNYFYSQTPPPLQSIADQNLI